MAEIVFGGREAIEEQPAMLAIVNANSPLRYDDRMLEAMIVLSEARQPVIVTPAVIMGAMAPVSLPAALAQSLAEAFAAIALIQLIRPGCPTVMGEFVAATDMRSGSPGFGGPEVALGLLCAGQLARHYHLPWRAGAGAVTTSQVVDAQAGYESMQIQSAAFLAGANVVVHSAGALDSLLVASCDKFMLDIELLRTLRAQYTLPEVDEASLAFDAHLEVGHGGHFFGAEHTLSRFRDCFHHPWLATTANHTRWVRDGSLDTAERAAALWPAALEASEQPSLDNAVSTELDEFVDRRRRELGDA
jgi:trimethylamine--corrinoid protein Co-methyltransferase